MPGRKRDKINTPVNSPDDPMQNDPQLQEEISRKQSGLPEGEDKIGETRGNRSDHDLEKGGENEVLGEPAPGYHSVAPGKQGGGKR